MSQVRILKSLVATLPRVVNRRLRKGPARPSWTFGYELIAASFRATTAGVTDHPYEVMRRAFDRFPLPTSKGLVGVTRSSVDARGVPSEWFTPAAHDDQVVLYFHGGGYVFGSTRSHRPLISRIATASRARVLGANYRLRAGAPVPRRGGRCPRRLQVAHRRSEDRAVEDRHLRRLGGRWSLGRPSPEAPRSRRAAPCGRCAHLPVGGLHGRGRIDRRQRGDRFHDERRRAEVDRGVPRRKARTREPARLARSRRSPWSTSAPRASRRAPRRSSIRYAPSRSARRRQASTCASPSAPT